jgi:TolB-like protein/tetratricopeptide (TPR) repeat protein
VCYAHEDSDAVYPELERLKDLGVNIWYDEGITPGQEWTQELAEAIQGASHILYFVSPSSAESRNCRNEIQFAASRDKPVIAVHLRSTELPSGLELSIGLAQGILKYQITDEDYRRKVTEALGLMNSVGLAARSPQVMPFRRRSSLVLATGITIAILAAAISGVWWSQRFGEGVAEELLNRMIRLGDVRVISRHSSFAYGGSGLDIREIGEQLGASYLLQGSVRRDAGIVRIAVHLTDSAAGTEIWANSYDRDLSDMLRVQDEIASVVLGELLPNIVVTPSVQPAVDPLAYELYLQARSAIAANDPISAKPLLQSATTLDDEFSNAYAALADVHESLRIYGFPIFVGNEELQRVLDRALELDPENLEALAVEAILQFYVQSDMAQAISKFERLLRGSSNTRALHHYRQLLIAMGRFEDLLLIAKRRRELDPHSRITMLTEFWAYMWLGEFSLARETANRVPLEAVSESGWSGRRPWLILVDLATGQHEAAEANLSLLGPEFDEQGRLYFQLWLAIERGDLDAAQELYTANPIDMSALPFSTWLPFDAVLTGDISRTIDEIEQPTDPRSIVWITQLPSRDRWISEYTAPVFGETFESLRRDQRYGRALESYGIDEVSLSHIELHTADLWD